MKLTAEQADELLKPIREALMGGGTVDVEVERGVVRVEDPAASPWATYEPGRGTTYTIRINGGAVDDVRSVSPFASGGR